jgi:wobble nucleotide-excising tRNase
MSDQIKTRLQLLRNDVTKLDDQLQELLSTTEDAQNDLDEENEDDQAKFEELSEKVGAIEEAISSTDEISTLLESIAESLGIVLDD